VRCHDVWADDILVAFHVGWRILIGKGHVGVLVVKHAVFDSYVMIIFVGQSHDHVLDSSSFRAILQVKKRQSWV
jgi:hypothetical protein